MKSPDLYVKIDFNGETFKTHLNLLFLNYNNQKLQIKTYSRQAPLQGNLNFQLKLNI